MDGQEVLQCLLLAVVYVAEVVKPLDGCSETRTEDLRYLRHSFDFLNGCGCIRDGIRDRGFGHQQRCCEGVGTALHVERRPRTAHNRKASTFVTVYEQVTEFMRKREASALTFLRVRGRIHERR